MKFNWKPRLSWVSSNLKIGFVKQYSDSSRLRSIIFKRLSTFRYKQTMTRRKKRRMENGTKQFYYWYKANCIQDSVKGKTFRGLKINKKWNGKPKLILRPLHPSVNGQDPNIKRSHRYAKTENHRGRGKASSTRRSKRQDKKGEGKREPERGAENWWIALWKLWLDCGYC